MNCIFCNDEINEKNFSREHIIPESLGGKFVIDNVCKECNNGFFLAEENNGNLVCIEQEIKDKYYKPFYLII